MVSILQNNGPDKTTVTLLGPNSHYFWKGSSGSKWVVLQGLAGLIEKNLKQGKHVESVALGKSSGIAIFTDGVRDLIIPGHRLTASTTPELG